MDTTNIEVPAPMTLGYNGKTYILTPLGTRDLVEHANYLRDQYIEQAKKDLRGLPKEIAIDVFNKAKRYADKIKPVTEQYIELAQTYDGLVYQFYLSVRKKHADVSLELAAQILESNFGEISGKANAMAGFKPVEDGSPLGEAAAE